jgi:hypothetical protein
MKKYGLLLCGFLDIVSFILTSKLGLKLLNFSNYRFDLSSVLSVLELMLILSLPITGILLLLRKKAGLILYYYQFPFRMGFLILSFGFLLKIFRQPFNTTAYNIILVIVILLEIIRLSFSIVTHKKINKTN